MLFQCVHFNKVQTDKYGKKVCLLFPAVRGALVLLLMEINKLSILLHFSIEKHFPSYLGKERRVESQLFCCSHFPFAFPANFSPANQLSFWHQSVQHKDHRIFFPFTLCSPKSVLEIDGQREKHKQIIDCFQVSGQSSGTG